MGAQRILVEPLDMPIFGGKGGYVRIPYGANEQLTVARLHNHALIILERIVVFSILDDLVGFRPMLAMALSCEDGDLTQPLPLAG